MRAVGYGQVRRLPPRLARPAVLGVLRMAALALAGCDSEPKDAETELAYEVVGDAADPSMGRTTLVEGASGSRVTPHVLPGSEPATFGIARNDDEAASLWDTVGFDGPAPSLAADEALVIVAGGQSAHCPWDPTTVWTSGTGEVLVYLDKAPPPQGPLEQVEGFVSDLRQRVTDPEPCREGHWQPRALALTVPTGALPSPSDDRQEHFDGLALNNDLSYHPVVPLDPASPLWNRWIEGDPYVLSRQETEGTSQPARLGSSGITGPVTVTALPGMDTISFQLDWRKRPGDLSATYVQQPPVNVDGDAFVKIRLHHTAAPQDPTLVPHRIEAPASAAITELVRIPDEESLTWIVGVEGGQAPLAAWMDTFSSDRPGFTGWIRTIAIRHDT